MSGSNSITAVEFHGNIELSGAHLRQRAQAIKHPIETNMTGRNHLSKNFCMEATHYSAAAPPEMVSKEST
jgi:hypothetical protein